MTMEEKHTEETKPIPGFNYTISNSGIVKNGNGDVIKPNKWTNYPRIKLFKDGKRHYFQVHRLVAMLFVDNPHNKPIACHKDNDPNNTHASNIYWGTYSDNNVQAIREGRRKNKKGIPCPHISCEKNGNSIFSNIQVIAIRDAIRLGHPLARIGRYFKTTRGTIWKIKAGYSWYHL